MTGRPYAAIDALQHAAMDDLYAHDERLALRCPSELAVHLRCRSAVRLVRLLFGVKYPEQVAYAVLGDACAPAALLKAGAFKPLPLNMPVSHILPVCG